MSRIVITRHIPPIAEELLLEAGHEVIFPGSDATFSAGDIVAQLNAHQAEALLSGAFESLRKIVGNEYARTISAMNNLALALKDVGKIRWVCDIFVKNRT